MGLYKVVARQYGNSVQFEIASDSDKEALGTAKKQARDLFDYEGVGDEPTVSVKPVDESE